MHDPLEPQLWSHGTSGQFVAVWFASQVDAANRHRSEDVNTIFAAGLAPVIASASR